jgi:hypothetical protein
VSNFLSFDLVLTMIGRGRIHESESDSNPHWMVRGLDMNGGNGKVTFHLYDSSRTIRFWRTGRARPYPCDRLRRVSGRNFEGTMRPHTLCADPSVTSLCPSSGQNLVDRVMF